MRIRLLALVLIIGCGISAIAAPPEEEGKTIFNSRCAACHNVNKVLTGPALAGVHERRSMEWIVNFVQSSQTMVKSGDKDAVALFEQFNRIPMPDHRDLKTEDINNLVAFIKANTVSTESKAPFATPSKMRPAYVPASLSRNTSFFISFFVAVVLLIGALLLWVNVKEAERAMNSRRA